LRVGLAFGPIWALWHLPLFLIDGTYQHSLGIVSLGGLAFLISTTALTILVSFAYERLAGLVGAISVHFASNTVPTMLGLTALSSVVLDAAAKVLMAVAVLYLWKTSERPATLDPGQVPRPTQGVS